MTEHHHTECHVRAFLKTPPGTVTPPLPRAATEAPRHLQKAVWRAGLSAGACGRLAASGAGSSRQRRSRARLGGLGRAPDPRSACRGAAARAARARRAQVHPRSPADPLYVGPLTEATGQGPSVPSLPSAPLALGTEAGTTRFKPSFPPPLPLQAVPPGRRLLPPGQGERFAVSGPGWAPSTWPWASLRGARARLPVAMGTARGTPGAVVPCGEGRPAPAPRSAQPPPRPPTAGVSPRSRGVALASVSRVATPRCWCECEGPRGL